MKFLRCLLGINKLGRERNQSVRENLSAEHCSGNTAISTKVATAPIENGHKQDTETSTKVYGKSGKNHKTSEENMEEQISL